ncbi:MAG TPA: hypothetical protein VEF04_09225 [Blastocatellia bacterium]|nr:hypothetical protein [Blastocatellia bacterium]
MQQQQRDEIEATVKSLEYLVSKTKFSDVFDIPVKPSKLKALLAEFRRLQRFEQAFIEGRRARTDRKAEAARENGKRGGRPITTGAGIKARGSRRE